MSSPVARSVIIVSAIACTLVVILLAIAPARLARQARTTALESPDLGAGIAPAEHPLLEVPDGIEIAAVDGSPRPVVVNPEVAVPAGQGACYIYQASLPTDPVQVGLICSMRTRQECQTAASGHPYFFREGLPCHIPAVPECNNIRIVAHFQGQATNDDANTTRDEAQDACIREVNQAVLALPCPQGCYPQMDGFEWLDITSRVIPPGVTRTETIARCAGILACWPHVSR